MMGPPAHAKENTCACLACNNGPNRRKLERVVAPGCAGGVRKQDPVAVSGEMVVPLTWSTGRLAAPQMVSPDGQAQVRSGKQSTVTAQ